MRVCVCACACVRGARAHVCVCVCVGARARTHPCVEHAGLRNRQTGSHGLNEFSSRSHSMLTVTIDSETQPYTDDDNLYVTRRGKLTFVDLAGQCLRRRRSSHQAKATPQWPSRGRSSSLVVCWARCTAWCSVVGSILL